MYIQGDEKKNNESIDEDEGKESQCVVGGLLLSPPRPLEKRGSAGFPRLRERWPPHQDKGAVAVVTVAALGLERTATGVLG